jgi:hypothetical protein
MSVSIELHALPRTRAVSGAASTLQGPDQVNGLLLLGGGPEKFLYIR